MGCGEEHREGYVNVDVNKLANPDVVHDLNAVPYPFQDSEFDEVYCSHVLEHLSEPFKVMKELNRILRNGGVLILKVPHFSRGFTNSEHKAGFDVSFPLYFNKGFTKSGYYGVDFELEKMRLRWLQNPKLLRLAGFRSPVIWLVRGIASVFDFFAGISPYFCSRFWCFYVGGFEEIEFRFICRKKGGRK